jgi:hypothetical protein
LNADTTLRCSSFAILALDCYRFQAFDLEDGFFKKILPFSSHSKSYIQLSWMGSI